MQDVIDDSERKIVKIPAHAGCFKRPSFVNLAEKNEK